MMENLRHIIESLLFVSEGPLPVDKIRQIIPEVDAGEIRQALSELQQEYERRNGGFQLKEVASGFQFRTNPEYRDWVTRLLQPNPSRLSKAALETLAIIAYHQPIIRADIEHIRGVDSGGVLRMMMERKLIRVLGRKDIPGRPLIYATTSQFLELFGLKNLKSLPTLKEIEEFGRQDEGGTPNPLAADHMPANDSETPAAKSDGGTEAEVETGDALDSALMSGEPETGDSESDTEITTVADSPPASDHSQPPEQKSTGFPAETMAEEWPADPETPPLAEENLTEPESLSQELPPVTKE